MEVKDEKRFSEGNQVLLFLFFEVDQEGLYAISIKASCKLVGETNAGFGLAVPRQKLVAL